ncbi:substrate-binding periplasmic protein [Vibrio sp. M260118]|uniref:substrate-binding periplasmic protein n=1 Tax=Vibrio sp. M260118 TaxID=3020896 RepID=UPI002F3EE3A1
MYIKFTLPTLCAFLLVSAPVYSLDEPANSEQKTILICAGDWPPFISQDIEGYGFAAQIITAAFTSQGYQVEYQFFPWSRVYHKAQKGECDATAIWMHTQERAEHFFFSDEISNEEFVFFYNVDQPFDWKELKDISGLKLGGGLEYSYGPDLDKMIEENKVEITRMKTTEQNMLQLAHNRIDIVPEEVHIGYHKLERLPNELKAKITHHPRSFSQNSNYLMFPKAKQNSEELLSTFNHGLQRWKRENPDSPLLLW